MLSQSLRSLLDPSLITKLIAENLTRVSRSHKLKILSKTFVDIGCEQMLHPSGYSASLQTRSPVFASVGF